ncbi:MAG: serine/threonine-protein kinase [Polyangiales bacterium]
MNRPGGAHREPSLRSEPGVPDIDVSRFEIMEQIGSGGMGTVYRALQRSVGRNVAVKVLAAEQAANVMGLARFVREANAIARIAHPNIVQLIDFGRDQYGRMLLVMELLEGESLRDLLRRSGTLPPERASHVAVQILGALRSAHAAGIVHRDLKPENIFIQRVGDEDVVKVLDFGVAKIALGDDAPAEHHTSDGTMVGTLRYMAPEQVAGEAPDHRVDVYAVGVLMYEMLSGSTPFDTRDRFVLLRQILTETPTPLCLRNGAVSPALSEVVMAALRKVAAERYPTADSLRGALLPFLAPQHARRMELSESRGALPTRSPTQGVGEHRSGVVRLEAQGNLTAAQRPLALGVPSAPPPAAPPRSLAAPIAVVVASIALLAVGVFAILRTSRPRAAQAPAPAVAPASPAAPTLPAPPEAVPAAVATRMVLVDTTPRGASVRTPEGEVICPSTPCAVPVPMGQSRPVRVALGATQLDALLSASQSQASLDLTPLLSPPDASPPPRATPRPPRRERPRESIPMLLPGGG